MFLASKSERSTVRVGHRERIGLGSNRILDVLDELEPFSDRELSDFVE